MSTLYRDRRPNYLPFYWRSLPSVSGKEQALKNSHFQARRIRTGRP